MFTKAFHALEIISSKKNTQLLFWSLSIDFTFCISQLKCEAREENKKYNQAKSEYSSQNRKLADVARNISRYGLFFQYFFGGGCCFKCHYVIFICESWISISCQEQKRGLLQAVEGNRLAALHEGMPEFVTKVRNETVGRMVIGPLAEYIQLRQVYYHF